MASPRTLLCVCTVLLVLLVADVSVAADVHHQSGTVTGSVEKFHLRGNSARATIQETSDDSFEDFARRELGDYGSTPARSNCRVNCKR